MNNVLVDTSVWIEYFKNNVDIIGIVDGLLDTNQIRITGPVITELIQGVKTETDLELLKRYIDAIPYEPCNIDDWINAGMLSYKLRREGKTIPVTYMLIAAVSMRCGMMVLTYDRHFDNIPGVKLFHKPIE